MAIETTEIGPESLSRYAEIPMHFRVESILRVEEAERGFGGLTMSEEMLDEPYVKDYEVEDEGPTSWPTRFDVSNWGFFLATAGGGSVGGAAVAYRTPEAHMLAGREDLAVLWDIRVHPDWRGKGLGRRLLQRVVDWSRRRDCAQLKIETQNVNVPACRLYAAAGCHLGGIVRHAYTDDAVADEVMLLWWLDL